MRNLDSLISPNLWEYFGTIPEKFRNDSKYSSRYHNELLKMMQLLVNEGLLTAEGNANGFDQRYRGNGYDANLANYGYYDFLILGFPVIRHHFEDAVRPVIINQGVVAKTENIGTGFASAFERRIYFVTARHCLPKGELINIPMFLPKDQPLIPVNVFVPTDPSIDLAVIELADKGAISDKWFHLGRPEILDPVLTMGFPPIPGFTDAIQVAETASIAASMKSTTGQITGQGIHYHGGMKQHFLISARVKGGNSGGPVINKSGYVVGVIIESLENGSESDQLGYGVALSAELLKDLLLSITGKEHKLDFDKVSFLSSLTGFTLS